MSLVELMIGMALGLFVVSVGLMGMTSHLRESRSLLLEARLMQDLRASADLMARGLRRAGHWRRAEERVWAGLANPHDTWTTDASQLRFGHEPAPGHDANTFGYRLRQGVIEMKVGDAPWQAMTDAGTLQVTALRITPQVQDTPLGDFCTVPCPPESAAACTPHHEVRSVALRIEGRAAGDATVTRHVQVTVRLRNDRVVGACAT